jgi:SpoVK/Ycf46/Vps4 family AAA+-type ATPase
LQEKEANEGSPRGRPEYWCVHSRRHVQSSQRAIEYGLPTPKGLLIIGIPGTGKSLTAKATANDVSQLPPEMLRKGRFDELFFVDLPNQGEREAIWGIQIGKYGRAPGDFDLVQLAKVTEGLTGSEIENAFVEALYLGFDAGKEPIDLDIASVLTEFVPLSKLMAEQIGALKSWAKGRARLATSVEQEKGGLKKIGV